MTQLVPAKKAKKKRSSWYIHMLLFIVVQIIIVTNQSVSGWMLFNLNSFGEWFIFDLDPLGDSFQFYDDLKINFLNFIWGIALTLHGISVLIYTILAKRNAKVS